MSKISTQEVDELVARAESEMRAGELPAALASWRAVSSARPDRRRPIIECARILLALGDFAAARDSWIDAVAIWPESLEAHRALTQIHHALDEAAHKQRHAAAAARIELLEAARAAHRERDAHRAVQLFEECAARFPDCVDAHLGLARARQSTAQSDEDWDAALSAWREVERFAPLTARALEAQVKILGRRAGSEALASAAHRLLALDPAHLVAHRFAARAATQSGEAKRAKKLEAALAKRAPTEPEAARVLIALYLDSSRESEAIPLIERLLSGDVKPADLRQAGAAYKRLGRLENALTVYEQLQIAEPDRGRHAAQVIALLNRLSRHEAVRERLEAAITAFEVNPVELLPVARTLEHERLDREAFELVERLERREPADPALLAGCASFYLDTGNLTHASRLAAAAASNACPPHLLESVEHGLARRLEVLRVDPLAPERAGDARIPELCFERIANLRDARRLEADSNTLAFVTSSLGPGGAERQLINTIRGVQASGRFARILVFVKSLRHGQQSFHLPAIESLPIEIHLYGPERDESAWHPLEDSRLADCRCLPDAMAESVEHLARAFVATRPGVVHSWQDQTNLEAGYAGIVGGVGHIVMGARSLRPTDRRRGHRSMRRCYQGLARSPGVTLLNNSTAGEADYAEWLDREPNPTCVIHNGLDLEAIEATRSARATKRIRRALKIEPSCPVIGSAFRMSAEKRPLLWIEVAARVAGAIPDAQFVIIGDGPLREEMVALARARGIADRLHLPGVRTPVAPWFDLMTITLLTSAVEGLPNVLLEAQAVGTPVVSTAVGGAAATIRAGITGHVCEDDSPEALAICVVECLRDAAWLQRARKHAPAWIRSEFALDSMIARTLSAYETCSNTSSP